MVQVPHEKIVIPSYYIVEGNIGAGKSTFLRLLKEHFDINIVYEPLDQWQNVGNGENLLDKFYQDTPRWAYTFQAYAFLTRLEKQRKEFTTHHVNIVERSVYSDRYCFAKNCFELGVMTSIEWEMYKKWFDWLTPQQVSLPQGFIYLRTDPEVSFNRLKKRHRQEEEVVALSYLTSVHDKHEEWLIGKKNIDPTLISIPVLVVDCNQDFESDSAVFEKIKGQIAQFMKLHPLK